MHVGVPQGLSRLLILTQGFGLCVCEDEGLPGKSPDHLLEKEGREEFAGRRAFYYETELSELRLELFSRLVLPVQGKSMSSLPGCMSLAAAPAAADSAEIAELQQAVVEELGISMEELRQFIDEELEKMDCIQQRKKQLAELETWVLQKESEVAYVDRLFDDASR